MMDLRRIRTTKGPLDDEFFAAPSKSATHRALLAAALADGASAVCGPLKADDTRITRDALVALGIPVRSGEDTWTVEGCGGEIPGGGDLFLGESGTSLRFLLALAALGRQPSRLDGASRLRERPLRSLIDVLAGLGAQIVSGSSPSGLPLTAGGSAVRGGRVRVPAGESSQYASALLLLGARLPSGIELVLEPPVVSLPYVELTAAVMQSFGVRVSRPDELCWKVEPGGYPGREHRVEGDHSSASYFLAAAAIVGGRVRVAGLDPASRQPDARLARILADLGCRVTTGADSVEVEGGGAVPAFDLDLREAPDLAPTVAVLGLFSEGRSVIRGVAHLRHKESDRLEMLATNLRMLGRTAHGVDDRLEIGAPTGRLRGARIATASDHRLAMAFAVAGLRLDGVAIDEAACVAKSNPAFWADFERLEGTVG